MKKLIAAFVPVLGLAVLSLVLTLQNLHSEPLADTRTDAEIIRLLRNPEIEILAPKDKAVNSTIHFLKRSDWNDSELIDDVRTLGGSYRQ